MFCLYYGASALLIVGVIAYFQDYSISPIFYILSILFLVACDLYELVITHYALKKKGEVR